MYGVLKRDGGNSMDLQIINRSIVMQLVFKHPGTTRSALAKQTGLTEAAISKIVNSLMELGVLCETGYVTGQRGRRAVGLQLNGTNHRVLAVKISRRKIHVGLFDLAAEEISSEYITFNEKTVSSDLLKFVKDKIYYYLEQEKNIRAIGIAVPGPYDYKKNYITVVTEMNNFVDVDLSPLNELDLNIPVLLTHDANAGVMSQWLHNEDSFIDNETIVYYLAGEGVGAGVISAGQLILGSSGMAAEIGHISLNVEGEICSCGNRGCLEMYCSSLAFIKKAKLMLSRYPNSILHSLESLSVDAIFSSARQGDDLAIQLTRAAGQALGHGAVNIINAYDPDVIILGDDMARGGDLILDEINKVVNERISSRMSHEINITIEDLTFDHILRGAASVAINRCLENPILLSEKKTDLSEVD